MKSSILLAGVSAITLAAAAPAIAATTTLSGGGSTAAAKVYRDIFNAYTAYNATKATSNYGIYDNSTISPGNPANVLYPTGPNTLAVQGTVKVVIGYEPVGSGAGLSAFTTGNPANFSVPSASNTIAYINETYTAVAAVPYPQIQFAASDAYLTGTGATSQAQEASTYDGNSVNDTNAFQTPTFALPIMFPVTGTSSSSVANVTTADLCAIYSGNATTTAAGVTLTEAVVRADSSGTSFIFANFLHQACTAVSSKYTAIFSTANGFPSTKPSWSAVFALGSNALPLVAETGTGGVAAEVSVPTGGTGSPNGGTAIGYASPDYVPPVASGNDYPATVNGISGIVNTSNVTGSTDEVYAAINGLTLPKTYVSTTIGQQLNDPLTSGKGNGYPVVGFTFIEAYKCYSTTIANTGTVAQGTALKKALEALYPTATGTNASNVLASQGFEPILSSGTSKTTGIYKLLIDGSVSAGYGPFGTYGIQGTQDPKNTTKNFACPAT
jgi:hypothetical protein